MIHRRAILLLILTTPSTWAQSNITVYTATYLPPVALADTRAQVIFLDQPQRMLEDLSRHITEQGTQGQAHTLAVEDILNRAGKDFLKDLQQQVTGLVAAWTQGIDKLPAIVIDDRYVFYGVFRLTDAENMLATYHAGAGP